MTSSAPSPDAYDNALCESFFATLECELLDRQRFCSPVREEEQRPEAVASAEKLRPHAATDEEVLYPAAILVGKYVKQSLRD
jgi:hypothetical protein